jgi:myo-inositol-1(or 4)-monophosphatase
MITRERLSSFADRMSLAIRQGGVVARFLQGRVGNEGKFAEALFPDDPEALVARRAAKTVADEIVQEILLMAAAASLNTSETALDAEEDTPSTTLFSNGPMSVTLVLDPIDGTAEYLSGQDSYSVSVGLVDRGQMVSALVYFPARGQFYFLGTDGVAYLARDYRSSRLDEPKQVVPMLGSDVRRVYKNGRVPEEVVRRLEDCGYEVVDDTSVNCRDAIVKCISGEAIAYLAHTRNMRDIILGAIVAGTPGGYALNWEGRALEWPASGRVARAVFGVGAIPEALLECVARDSS